MNSQFFILKDGVYTVPMLSLGGTVQASYFVPGNPIPSPRPRMGKYHVYHAANADQWMHSIMMFTCLKIHAPLEGPVEVNLQFLFDRPKKDAKRFWMDHKPDLDNLEKAVLDALTKARKWKDDCQVVHLQSIKRYAADDEHTGVHIEIATLPQTMEERPEASSRPSVARGFYS